MSGIPHPTGNIEKDEANWGEYRYPGDVHNSKCHDFLCCIVWVLLFVVLIVLCILGVCAGRPWAMYRSWDTTGNYCGIDNEDLKGTITNLRYYKDFELRDFTDQPLLFFGFPKEGFQLDRQICVAECPGDEYSFAEAIENSCDDSKRICPSYLTEKEKEEQRKKKDGLCVCPYPSKPIFNRCIPVLSSDVAGSLKGNFTNLVDSIEGIIGVIPGFGQAVTSVSDLWAPILIASILSLVVAFIWICFLRCLPGCIVYTSVILVPILVAVLGFWLFMYGNQAFEFNNDQYNKYMAYAVWAVAAILLVIIIFLFKKLKQAVQIIKISARALGSNISILFTPIISLFIAVIFLGIIVISCVFNYSSGDFVITDKEGQPYLAIEFSKTTQYLLIYNLIYGIFICVFIYFLHYFAISSSLVQWYFSDHKGHCCSWLYGYILGMSKYIGTITASAAIMTPIYLFIIFMEYLEQKTRLDDSKIGCFIRFLIKCCKCCLICFEKIMKYLNKALLTVSQIYNRSWVKSAQITLDIVLSDLIMTALINGVSTFILFLSKIIVSGVTTLCFFIYIKYQGKDQNGWIFPSAIVFILSYLISSFLINMYDSVIDIIFICFQADKDLTSSGSIRPMYIDSDMNQLMDDLEKAGAQDSKVEDASDQSLDSAKEQ